MKTITFTAINSICEGFNFELDTPYEVTTYVDITDNPRVSNGVNNVLLTLLISEPGIVFTFSS